jgi:hypothetical protein
MSPRPAAPVSITSMFLLFISLLLGTVEAKGKYWSFGHEYGWVRSGAHFNEVTATLGECDFPNVPRSCEYKGQQVIENAGTGRTFTLSVDGCSATVALGDPYSCNPQTHTGVPGAASTCQSFVYGGAWYYGTYKGYSSSNTGSFFQGAAVVDQILALGC